MIAPRPATPLKRNGLFIANLQRVVNRPSRLQWLGIIRHRPREGGFHASSPLDISKLFQTFVFPYHFHTISDSGSLCFNSSRSGTSSRFVSNLLSCGPVEYLSVPHKHIVPYFYSWTTGWCQSLLVSKSSELCSEQVLNLSIPSLW